MQISNFEKIHLIRSSPDNRMNPCVHDTLAAQVSPQPTLPGTIYTVAAEVEAMGAKYVAMTL